METMEILGICFEDARYKVALSDMIVTVCIFFWSVLYNIPRCIMLEPTMYWERSINHSWIRLEPTKPSMNIDFLVIYFGYFATIFKVVIPIVIVSVANAILLCCLRRRNSAFVEHVQISNDAARNAPSNDSRVTTVVFAITWTFLISQTFAGAQVLLLLTGHNACGDPCHLFNQVCDLVFVLVSATNFLLYYAFGQRFRRIIRGYFCKSHVTSTRRYTFSSASNEMRLLGRNTTFTRSERRFSDQSQSQVMETRLLSKSDA
ncbi:probable G-protein coupled receptor frpr-1 [Aplysia californica]|uniref:Probable G-protein coupled receptor frpr-1 n=1 Tax=Aplysia californica TaxID=6500 RepID=A0ABM1VV79_APLCA|nr:probable G-protein coupled receptor frpr-1 [Aplysia californica]